MEVGAVKQAFNNEVIQLKRNLNQAKIQIIHKLTRKAKTLTEKKKGPEKLQEKFKRKAESAVNEVLIMKKIKPKDIAKFAVTHTGNLQEYLNKPKVDHDKVCARLLLHKSLQGKYNYIRNTFTNIPINDLLMSRHERRKMKKEAQEKQKMKRDKKRKVVSAEGDWKVENLKSSKSNDDDNAKASGDEMSGDDEGIEAREDYSKEENAESGDEESKGEERSESDIECDEMSDNDQGVEAREDNSEEENAESGDEELKGEERSESDIGEQNDKERDDFESKIESDQEMDNDDEPDDQSDDDANVDKFVRPSPVKIDIKPKGNQKVNNKEKLKKPKTKPEFLKKPPKPKDVNKNKNLNEKLISRRFKKETSELEVRETKVVDPFFITSTGESYMSVAEPRQPDEVKEVHKEGNRKLRRAVMFGHVPKVKPRSDNSFNYNRQNDSQGGFRNNSMQEDGNYKNNFNRNNSQFKDRNDSQFKGRNDSQFKGRNDDQFKGRNAFKNNRSNATAEPKVEKLHPSWEAKKKKSGILPYQGKKIVFDES